MKKALYIIAFILGFLMILNESGVFIPNIIGFVLFIISGYKLGFFDKKSTSF